MARGCPSRSWPKYASRSHPSMRELTLMQTACATTDECPRRRARKTWPKPPSPRNRSTRYESSVSGLRSEEHTSELQSRSDLVCRLLLEKKSAWPPADDHQWSV